VWVTVRVAEMVAVSRDKQGVQVALTLVTYRTCTAPVEHKRTHLPRWAPKRLVNEALRSWLGSVAGKER
jgi:hypothetical protein